VVIGILIALQINNWNEDRKTRQSERQYLERLRIDLVSDSIYLTRRIKESNAGISGGKFYGIEAYKTQENFNEYMALMNNLHWNSEHFVVQKSTFDELSSSGRFNIISNEHLKKNILDHYLIYESNASHIKEGNEFSVGEMSKIISIWFNGWNIVKVNKALNLDVKMDWEFINDPTSKKFIEMETAISIYTAKHEQFKLYFEESLKRIRTLLKEIDEELKNHE